ncbi:PaaI family thioesterase [Crenobacter cavernae]|uniref:PaaI family thioesterase n=1 Tax=Crenobacter cavernae TaxID=2290923 RepID=A0ABY0FGC7_9NEIS|nr:hypothetical protein [Crenobacter cavernae]RXZ45435.1 hypothetical protein EBB06_01075 [Crenobacter cavernae]
MNDYFGVDIPFVDHCHIEGISREPGRVLRGGRSLVFCEGEVRDENGERVAKAMGIFKLRFPPATQGGDGE